MEATETVTLHVPSNTRYLSLVGACVAEVCRRVEGLPDPEKATYDIQLAVNEAAVNAIKHAHGNRPHDQIKVVFSLFPRRLKIDIYDWGEGFDLTAVPDPDLEEPHEGGYGLMIIKKLMDEVSYHRDPARGNQLHLVKYLRGEDHVG